MERKNIGPFTKGMNTLADETALPEDQCRSAKNIDFDKDGNYSQRPGFARLLAAVNVHSLYSSANSAYVLGCQKNNIGYYNLSDFTFYSKAVMPEAFRTSWTVHDDVFYASNPAFNCKFAPITYEVLPLAVSLPVPPTIGPQSYGGLRQGAYSVAISVTDASGEESPLGTEVQVDVPEGGGIAITGVEIIPGSYIRIYATQQHGEELYRMIEAPMIAPSFSIGASEMDNYGAQPETRFLEALPFGHFIDSHHSRLFVAFDNFIGFSNAFRPHLWDPRHNFIPLESTVMMMVSVADGIFISDQHEVKFLRGDDPEQFEVKHVDADPAIFGSAIAVPGAHFGGEMSQHDKIVVWLSKTGHQAGLPDGSVVRLNPGQLNLPNYSVASSAFAIQDGVKRILVPVNSNRRNGTGTAVDSEIF
jgi:hypothetical protein